jgi:exopolyphosphatase / guanosine-5'-triphosphate,3'-diphosphate pyrophosphatase
MRFVSGTPSNDMPGIVPRWEWRTFGTHFGRAEDHFAALTPREVKESDELYFLSANGDTVKVRDDLMDIKVLKEVNADGLEQWTPVMKAAFPLAAADVAKVFEALRLDTPPFARDAYTLDQFIDELALPGSGIRVVHVHKRRARYSFGGCMAELTDVVAERRPTRTIAIESEDPSAVIAAVGELGLGDYLNTSYARGLAALLGEVADRYAMIDVGTNSVKFLVGERARDGNWRAVVDRAELTRLGEGLDKTGEIAPDALERTAVAIAGMVDEAKRIGAIAIAMVGTAGLRVALNSDDVIAAIRERTGITLEVISGEYEGRLAYLAVLAGLRLTEGSSVVFDTGGGSTQFTFGHGGHVDEQFSVQVGAVRYTERFGLDGVVPRDVLNEALAAIAADLIRIDGHPPPDALVGMGGALTNIAAVKHALKTYDPDVVQGTVLDRVELDRQIELYRSRDVMARRAIVGLQPKRADVILAGACIVRTIMEKLDQQSLIVSDRGLRHGLLIERFGAAGADTS